MGTGPAWLLILSTLGLYIWSYFGPSNSFIWFLESFPVLIGAVVLWLTHKSFPLTPLAYLLLWLHAAVLMVGACYTYAEVPLFNSLQDMFGLSRNPYDKVGHFAQGFVPAMLTREILLRKTAIARGAIFIMLVIAVPLAISALYEVLEWLVAAGTGEAADAFLGTQGDVWDTQKDMAFAGLGAITALLSLSRRHDRQLTQQQGNL